MHMLLVIAFLEKVNYGGNFSPKVLKKKDVKHYFNYPRYPKGQERMNRTLQEEFVMCYED